MRYRVRGQACRFSKNGFDEADF